MFQAAEEQMFLALTGLRAFILIFSFFSFQFFLRLTEAFSMKILVRRLCNFQQIGSNLTPIFLLDKDVESVNQEMM